MTRIHDQHVEMKKVANSGKAIGSYKLPKI